MKYGINTGFGLRSALMLGAASVAALGLSCAAVAQESGTVETVVVTGSRIPQQGLYSSSPVTAVGQQEMKFEGTTNVETLINNLPQAFADQGQMASNGASGTASVNLRDLGPKRTLVLIDGKRLMPGDPDALSHGTSGEADLDVIPSVLVDHIEVLTGGASAVYGSDAVAGVVNFIMRKDFEGVEVDGQYGFAEHANDKFAGLLNANGIPLPKSGIVDGGTTNGSLLIGANSANGKGNVTLYATYAESQPILESSRDFSACSTATNYNSAAGNFSGGFNCSGSSTIPDGRFIAVDRNAGGLPGTGGFTPDANRNFNPYSGQTFNFAPYNYLQRPDTRYTFGALGHYEINKELDIYSSLMFMDDHTVADVAPGGAFQTPFLINCDNPLLSPQELATICPAGVTAINRTVNGCAPAPAPCVFGVNANEATVLIGRRAVESGPRIDDLRHTAYRIVIGAKGDLGNGWTYDLYGLYGSTIYGDAQNGFWSESRFQKALQVTNIGGVPTCQAVIDGSDPNCVPLDVFAPASLTPQMLKYVQVPGIATGDTVEQVVSGSVNGDLGQWGVQAPWAKSPVALAGGFEYRQESLRYSPDSELQAGDLAGLGGPRPPAHGSYNVAEGFGEVRIPIAQELPFLEDLTANAGYRYSSYSIAGSTSTYKYGLEWQPIDDIRLRGSFDHAVRAPNVTELFTPTAVVLFGGQDPCANNARTNAPPDPALFAPGGACLRTGLTGADYGQILPCPASQCQQQISGNPLLSPEKSDTRSLGVVFTPTFFEGFTATIDYFDIKVNNVIGTFGAPFLLNSCFSGTNLAACSFIHRDPTTHFLWTGNGFVTNPGSNLGFLRTKGVDVEATYQADMEDWGIKGYGQLNFNLIGTYTDSQVTEPIPPANVFYNPSAPTYDCAGLFGLICGTPVPVWRHKFRVTWNSPWDFDVSIAWRHISGVQFDGNQVNPNLNDGLPYDFNDAKIPAFNYFDLAANWTVREGVSLRAGVNNVFDKEPPVIDTNNIGISAPPFGNGNTYPQIYDSVGRMFFVGATVKF